MTAIAVFSVSDCPVLFGDLATSGIEVRGRTATIPTIGRVTNFFPEGSGWTITGLAQKVTIIADECAVVWAGSHLGAKIAIDKLHDYAQVGRITRSTVSDLLASLPSELASLDISLLGVVVDSNGPFQFGFGDFDKFERADGSTAMTSGSGSDYLKRILARVNVSRTRGESSSVHPAQLAFEAAITTGGSLLRTERPMGFTLRNYFGGGYEVAVWNGERFTKDASITYILWDGQEPGQNGFAHPRRLISHLYDDGHLLIRTQELQQTTPGKFTFGEISFGLIHSMKSGERYIRPINQYLFQHDPHWICHCFLVSRTEKIQPFSMVERCYPGQGPYTRIETHGGIVTRLHMKGAFWNDLKKVFDAGPAFEDSPPGPWALCGDL